MDEVAVIDDPVAAAVAVDPIRSRLLAELRQPASAWPSQATWPAPSPMGLPLSTWLL
jgi:hypothetical protein